MSDEQTTKGRIRAIMEEHFGPGRTQGIGDDDQPWKEDEAKRSARSAAGQSHAGASEELDSLDKVEFIMAVEEEFGVEIPDEMVTHLHSINDVAGHVDSLIATRDAPAN